MNTLVVATTNKGKLAEIKSLSSGLGWNIKSLADFPTLPTIEEDSDTFEGNARKKAVTILETLGHPTLSDDSGLIVDALDGAPGVQSARYGSPDLDDKGRFELLLKNLEGVPVERRKARFKTAMVFAAPDFEPMVFEGIMEGYISMAPAGKAGFGYDPVFIPKGMTQTIAQLGAEVKNRISHRAKALAAFFEFAKTL